MNLAVLTARLKASEGWRSHVYLDTTGNLTIGWGHNLGHVYVVDDDTIKVKPVHGITLAMGEAMLVGDIIDTIEALRKALPWFHGLNEPQQQVLADMAFNLGVPGLLRWPIFLDQVKRGEYAAAARNMLATLWARQVGDRAVRLAHLMEHGTEP